MSTRGRYRKDSDLLDYIKDLERRLSALERTPQLPSAAANKGETRIQGGTLQIQRLDDEPLNEGAITQGSSIIVNGEVGMASTFLRSTAVPTDTPGIDGAISMQMATVDGSVADPSFRFSSWGLYDKNGDVVVSDSQNARRGLSDPVLHQTFQSGAYSSSTSGTFSSIMTSEWYMYHAHCRIRVLVQNDVGSASELRIGEVGGAPSLLVVSVPSGTFNYIDCVVRRSVMTSGLAPNGNPALLTLEHRRSSGAGTIRSQVISVVGIDLSWFQAY